MTEVLCVCCHDFLAEATGDESLRTKSAVQQFLVRNGIEIAQRFEPGLPGYIADQVWGYNRNLLSSAVS